MRYLSWDIGIKNLSYCLIEYNNSEINVIDWDIIDISGETVMNKKCQGHKKKCGSICGKTANYYVKSVDKYFCKLHQKNHIKVLDYNKRVCNHDLGVLGVSEVLKVKECKRKVYFETFENPFICYCKVHQKLHAEENMKEINKKKDLNDTCQNLINKLDKNKKLLDVDIVTIENQPALKNPIMKSIQMIIFTYFNLRGKIDKNTIGKILFLSASNKLKVKFEKKNELSAKIVTNNKYKKNKELAKIYCEYFLENRLVKNEEINKNNDINKNIDINKNNKEINKSKWIDFYNSHKKKDDLADTFLMNIYQIQMDNKI